MTFRAWKYASLVLLLAGTAVHAETPAAAPVIAPEVIAQDTVHAFDILCYATGADRNATTKLIPDDGVKGKMVPPKTTEGEQGAPGGISWYYRTDHGILVKVEYTPDNICSVEVPQVDTTKLGKDVADLLAAQQKDKAIRLAVKDDKTEPTGTLVLHRIFYMVEQTKLGTVGYLVVRLTDGGQLDEHRGQLSYVLTPEQFSDKKAE